MTVVRLNTIRDTLALPALKRYRDLKAKGTTEEEARNTACAQTVAELGGTFGLATIRRELDRLLDPAPGVRWGGNDPPHWRLP